jgi:hypothetical protein
MPAAKHLLLQLLPAVTASAGNPKQLLLQLLRNVVRVLCVKDSLRVGEVLQVLQHLPLPAEQHLFSLLASAYRDGEWAPFSAAPAAACVTMVFIWLK